MFENPLVTILTYSELSTYCFIDFYLPLKGAY